VFGAMRRPHRQCRDQPPKQVNRGHANERDGQQGQVGKCLRGTMDETIDRGQ
jgi:hypothetical protein